MTQSDHSVYPEHDKLMAVSEQSQAIGEFLESLSEYGLLLCDEPGTGRLHPTPTRLTVNEVLARYFGVDRNKLEMEKRAMLEAIRSAAE